MGANDQGADQTSQRWLTIPRTLCFVTHGDDILLMKRGEHKRIFPGRYNGLGGHIERDEDPLSSALREVKEESGLMVTNIRLRGVYNIDAGKETGIILFIFTCITPSREVTECSEGTLHWVPLDEVDKLPLVEDLPYLLPRLFGPTANDTILFAHASYDAADQFVLRFA
jgi:8-oxo-dGTP diphosphatase